MNLFTNASSAIGNNAGEIYCTLKKESWNSQNKKKLGDHSQDSPTEGNEFIRLSIEDTGPGIPNTHVHRIFEPYFTTKELGTGTGLGLALTHTLVEKHGGFIRFGASKQMSGACFEIYIPAISGEFESATFEEPEVAPMPTGSESILIVEDNETIAEMLGQYLSGLGYITASCGNGEDALETYQNAHNSFDLIITDQTMPSMNGDTMIKKIMAINSQQPIILCTGFSDSINEEQALEMGVRHFLMKPVSIIALGKLVREVFDEPT
jgi:two-component system cell cycle sensor histidine kinase/response regulator CckA